MVVIHGKVKYYTIWLTNQTSRESQNKKTEVRIKVQDKHSRSTSNRKVTAFIPGSDRRLKSFPDLQLYYDDYRSYGFSDQEASWMTGAIATESISDHSMTMAQLFALITALVAEGYQFSDEILMEKEEGSEPAQSIFVDPYRNVVFRNPVTGVIVTHQQLGKVEDQADQFRALVVELL